MTMRYQHGIRHEPKLIVSTKYIYILTIILLICTGLRLEMKAASTAAVRFELWLPMRKRRRIEKSQFRKDYECPLLPGTLSSTLKVSNLSPILE